MPESARLAEARSIIVSLPDITEIWHLARSENTEHRSPEEREAKWKQIETFRAAFRRLHALVKVNDHTSDFPGLLALGAVRWQKDKQLYELHCGVSDVPGRATPPWYSRAWVRFDLNGKIREIKPHGENW